MNESKSLQPQSPEMAELRHAKARRFHVCLHNHRQHENSFPQFNFAEFTLRLPPDWIREFKANPTHLSLLVNMRSNLRNLDGQLVALYRIVILKLSKDGPKGDVTLGLVR